MNDQLSTQGTEKQKLLGGHLHFIGPGLLSKEKKISNKFPFVQISTSF